MAHKKPLDAHQQELVSTIRAAHKTLALARKTRVAEIARRTAAEKERLDANLRNGIQRIEQEAAAAKLRLQQETQRSVTESVESVRIDVDREVAVHESNLDEALIAAYNDGVPIRRIALEGFGNRYDGGVQQLLTKLRNDGRIGHREGYQRNTSNPDEVGTTVEFPKPLDVERTIRDTSSVAAPRFTQAEERLELVPADKNGENGVTVQAVILEMDPRDPYFKQIKANARPGTPYLRATTATLYRHPATDEIVAYESRETGELLWDHPVARWAKENYGEVEVGFDAALASAE